MEIWAKIDGYSNYEVSSLGRVKSLNYNRENRAKVLKNDYNFGYAIVRFSKNNKTKKFRVHRLVAEAFVPNTENKTEINHINGIKNDNRAENLEWCTSSENQIHAIETGLYKPKKGELHYNSKLTNKQAEEIRKIHKETGCTHRSLAEKYNLSRRSIGKIVNNKTYCL